jgi:hypothetical protein
MIVAYPAFLWALGLIALPIIIHLFNFRRYRKVQFSNVEMLKQIESRSRKSRQLKRWLILAARVLALSALVLAFAQPFIPHSTTLGKRELTSIYIDNSLSMTAEGVEGILFEAAKNSARTLIASYPPETRFQILNNDRASVSQKLLSKRAAIDFIDAMEISTHKNSLELILEGSNRLRSREFMDAQRFYLFSDFQKAFHPEPVQTDSSQTFNLIPLQPGQTQNLSIDSAWLAEPVSIAGSPIHLNVRIVNNGSSDVESATLSLYINGTQQGAESFSVQGNSSQLIDLEFRTSGTGWIGGQLSINDYPVTFDDNYFFTIQVKSKLNILVISPESIPSIAKVFADDPGFLVKFEDPRRLQFGNLKDQDLIIVGEIPEISSGLAQELKSFVESGKVLLLIPGLNPASYSNFQSTVGLPEFGEPKTVEVSVTTESLKHQLYKGVYKDIPQNTYMPRFDQYYSYATTGLGFEPVLRLRNSDIALGMLSRGRGLIYQFSFSLDPEWSNFSEHELFVASLLKIAFSKAVEDRIALNLNDRNPLQVNTANRELGFVLAKEQTEVIVEHDAQGGQLRITLNDEINEEGIYELRANQGDSVLSRIGINQDRAESIQDYFDESELSAMIPNPNFRVLKGTASELKEVASFGGKGKPLWKLFVILCLIFLLIEILLLRFIKS